MNTIKVFNAALVTRYQEGGVTLEPNELMWSPDGRYIAITIERRSQITNSKSYGYGFIHIWDLRQRKVYDLRSSTLCLTCPVAATNGMRLVGFLGKSRLVYRNAISSSGYYSQDFYSVRLNNGVFDKVDFKDVRRPYDSSGNFDVYPYRGAAIHSGGRLAIVSAMDQLFLLSTRRNPRTVTPVNLNLRGQTIRDIQWSKTNVNPDALTCADWVVTLRGTRRNDRLRGTEGGDVLMGFGGKDVIDGLAGNDIICGGPGDDTLTGGLGDDVIYGADGDDELVGGSGNDFLLGENGDDNLVSDGGRDRLEGGDGIDSCSNATVVAECE